MELNVDQKEEYKETELGLLPKDWEVVRLKDIAKIKYGKANPHDTGDVPVVGSGGIYSTTANPLVNYPTIIIGRKGTAGKVWLFLNPCYPSDTTFYLEWKKDIGVSFIFYYMTSNPLSGEHAKTTLPSLQKSELENYFIPLPPLQTQQKIAFVLSTIQESKEKTEDVIKATKELKKSMMKYLFTYGPVPLEKSEIVSLKEAEIGLVPEDWEVVRLGDVAKISSGGAAPQGKDYFNGRHPFIRVQHIDNEDYIIRRYDLITDKAVIDYKLKLFPKGTIVFPKSGASVYLEKRAILPVDAYVVSHLCAVISNKECVLQDFLFYVLKNIKLAKEKANSYPTLNLSEVKKVKIPLPPLQTQQKIASILSAIDQKIEAEENKKKVLEDLFQSLLHNLMTAKIRVNHLEKILDV